MGDLVPMPAPESAATAMAAVPPAIHQTFVMMPPAPASAPAPANPPSLFKCTEEESFDYFATDTFLGKCIQCNRRVQRDYSPKGHNNSYFVCQNRCGQVVIHANCRVPYLRDANKAGTNASVARCDLCNFTLYLDDRFSLLKGIASAVFRRRLLDLILYVICALVFIAAVGAAVKVVWFARVSLGDAGYPADAYNNRHLWVPSPPSVERPAFGFGAFLSYAFCKRSMWTHTGIGLFGGWIVASEEEEYRLYNPQYLAAPPGVSQAGREQVLGRFAARHIERVLADERAVTERIEAMRVNLTATSASKPWLEEEMRNQTRITELLTMVDDWKATHADRGGSATGRNRMRWTNPRDKALFDYLQQKEALAGQEYTRAELQHEIDAATQVFRQPRDDNNNNNIESDDSSYYAYCSRGIDWRHFQFALYYVAWLAVYMALGYYVVWRGFVRCTSMLGAPPAVYVGNGAGVRRAAPLRRWRR